MTTQNASAIITGDLIASRSASTQSITNAMAALQDGANALARTWDCDPKFTRFRGDGWQIHLADPCAALDAVILLFASLKAAHTGIATRAAIGIAPVDHPGTRDLSDGTGKAFFLSGDALGNMDKQSRLRITGHHVTPWHEAVCDLLDFQMAGWTSAQAQAVALSLTVGFERHEDIAAHLSITRQAVQMRLAAAGASHLQSALSAFRNHRYKPEV